MRLVGLTVHASARSLAILVVIATVGAFGDLVDGAARAGKTPTRPKQHMGINRTVRPSCIVILMPKPIHSRSIMSPPPIFANAMAARQDPSTSSYPVRNIAQMVAADPLCPPLPRHFVPLHSPLAAFELDDHHTPDRLPPSKTRGLPRCTRNRPPKAAISSRLTARHCSTSRRLMTSTSA
jgi:hypothetical protein